MKITPSRIVRFIIGAFMPIPCFISIFFFSYFYKSYHGFDFESTEYMTRISDLELSQQYLRTDLVVFLLLGYMLMGIPSIIYSFVLERYRGSPRFQRSSYYILGGAMAGMFSLIFILTNPGCFIVDIFDCIKVVVISIAVGVFIPFILLFIGRFPSVNNSEQVAASDR